MLNVKINKNMGILTEVVDKVTKSETGYNVVSANGTGFSVPYAALKGKAVNKGDVFTLYCCCGSMIVVMDLNGEELCLEAGKDEQEQKAERAQQDLEAQAKFEERKANLDARFDALPKLLQHRLAMFRMFDNTFRRDEEDYESSSMLAGYGIFLACKNQQEIEAFGSDTLSYNERVNRVPALAAIETFNQMDFAVRFALELWQDAQTMDLENPQKGQLLSSCVMNLANAMSPLSGCRCTPRKECIAKYVLTL